MVTHSQVMQLLFLTVKEQVFDCIEEYKVIEKDKKLNLLTDGEREEKLSHRVDSVIEAYNLLKKEEYHHPDMVFIGAFCVLAEHEREKEGAKSIPIMDM